MKHEIKRITVNSSNISEIGYDELTKTMEVMFKHGGVYHYSPITQQAYISFLRSKSKGEFFHQNIIKNKLIHNKKIK